MRIDTRHAIAGALRVTFHLYLSMTLQTNMAALYKKKI
jgi:hypothetical protein